MKHLPLALASAASLSLLTATAAAAGPHGGPGAQATMPSTATAPPAHNTSATTTTTTTTTMRGPTHPTGQPNQTCGSATAPLTPGGAASAPGSAFNPNGKAGTVYAGQQPQNSGNTVSSSQYDVACSHQK